jgi:transcriptional regulator with XRE-family HTH domain
MDDFELVLVEEQAVARVQTMVLRLLREKGISRTELADLLNVTPSYISQILGDEPANLSIKRAASIFHSLGERLEFSCEGVRKLDQAARTKKLRMKAMQSNLSISGRAKSPATDVTKEDFRFSWQPANDDLAVDDLAPVSSGRDCEELAAA